MKFTKITNYLSEKYLNIRNKNFRLDFNPHKIKTSRRALLYYKYSKNFENSKIGTTDYQCYELAKVLNKFGYLVTVVDRKVKFKIKHRYDIFVGAFNTGGFKYFNHILKQTSKNTKVIGISTGANPNTMKKEFQKRGRMFEKRNGIKLKNTIIELLY